MSAPPERVARHFQNSLDLSAPRDRSFVIGTLLEHGDGADLAWLAAIVERRELVDWLRRHGARQLSRRSRALWAATFELELDQAPPAAQALWPLA